jgi:TPP-dependent 2-oxoacid decarboxylase
MSQGLGTALKPLPTTVIEHVLKRLKSIGISEVFGAAGDYAFPVDDAVVKIPGIEWVGCCNELNASKAAEQGNSGAYIEVVTDKYAASPLSMKLHESVKTFYRS